MFDIGFLELVLVGIVALLVLGPERLPHAARMTGAFLGKLSRMMQSVRDEVEREVNIHEMQQRIKKQVEEGMIGDLKNDLAEANKAIQEGFQSTRNEPAPNDATPAALPASNNDATPDSAVVSVTEIQPTTKSPS
ncbi:MAG: Sec-independent protein translocase protein TatB [Nitrospira sp.]